MPVLQSPIVDSRNFVAASLSLVLVNSIAISIDIVCLWYPTSFVSSSAACLKAAGLSTSLRGWLVVVCLGIYVGR